MTSRHYLTSPNTSPLSVSATSSHMQQENNACMSQFQKVQLVQIA